MSTAASQWSSPDAPLFSDGLGDRVLAVHGATGERLQILRIRPALAAVPAFALVLSGQAARLASFQHASYARVRRVDPLQRSGQGLAIVSEHVEGTRLSQILRSAEERGLPLDINTALCLIRQLASAVAAFHEHGPDVAHGLIAPERLVVTPHARLVVVEHVLGTAVEQLHLTGERLWQELRVAQPHGAGWWRCAPRADVTAMGLVALALVIGRPLRAGDYQLALGALLAGARERSARGDEQPLAELLRDWLARSLELDSRPPFASAREALAVLEVVAAHGTAHAAAPIALERFLFRYGSALLEPPVSDSAEPAALASPPNDPGSVAAASAPAPADIERAVDPTSPTPPRFEVERREPSVFRQTTEIISVDALLAPQRAGGRPLFEEEPDAGTRAPIDASRGRPRWTRAAIAAAALVIVAAGSAAPHPSTMAPTRGPVKVLSTPPALGVVDALRGPTPARLPVEAGSPLVEMRGGVPRVTPTAVSARPEATPPVDLPSGVVSFDASPWAEVFIDGQRVGETPLGDLPVTLGRHDVLFRHPQLGERRHVISVTRAAPLRLSVDMK